MCLDPTRDEMLTACAAVDPNMAPTDFEVEEAIYWFACDYHAGQWSNLYEALCSSPFSPGVLANGPLDAVSMVLYRHLVSVFCPDAPHY